MLLITPQHKIFLGVERIDFRKGLDGMATICRQHWNLNPLEGHFFVFCNRRGNALRVLAHDAQGYWLAHKRLSQGTFRHWPKSKEAVLKLTHAQLHALLYNGNPLEVHTAPPWYPPP
jgi:transposase